MESINIHNFMGRSRCFVSDRKFGSSQSVKTKASRKRLLYVCVPSQYDNLKRSFNITERLCKSTKILYNMNIFVIIFSKNFEIQSIKTTIEIKKKKISFLRMCCRSPSLLPNL